MNDIAEPHNSSLVRDPNRSSRRGPKAAWMTEGSDGFPLTR
jgi:hypothetical protein